MKTRRILGIAALAFGLSGCIVIEMIATDAGIPSPSKVVAEKAPPDILVASDGTTCKVPEVRFDHVRIGQSITCVWTAHSAVGARTPISRH